MRKECFVDGGPHENRSVILGVPGISHPFNVCIYASGMQCTRNTQSTMIKVNSFLAQDFYPPSFFEVVINP
jgi:hypothetical protein